jgi:hypothetical protein
MIESIKKVEEIVEAYQNRIREPELLEALSLNMWKTRGRILELINRERSRSGKQQVIDQESNWQSLLGLDVSTRLMGLQIRKLVESKVLELEEARGSWTETSGTLVHEEEEKAKRGVVNVYKLTKKGGGIKVKNQQMLRIEPGLKLAHS